MKPKAEKPEETEVDEDQQTLISLDKNAMRKKKPKQEPSEKQREHIQNLNRAKQLAKYRELKSIFENEEEKPKEAMPEEPKAGVEQQDDNVLLDVKPNKASKKKPKRVIYEEESSDSDSSSDEEVIVRRKSRRKRREPKLKLTQEELLERELERRLALRQEQDEFAKMEKAALQKRYAEKLAEAQRSQLNGVLFPSTQFVYKKR